MNNLTKLSLSSLAVAAALVTTAASAEETFRQHGAHVHGEVELNMAKEGNQVLLEVNAPGADVVGFEHAPTNAEQESAIEDAIKKLKNAESLFVFSQAANCQLDQAMVDETLTKDSHDDHGHHDNHDNHDNHDHHEGHDHDDHAHHDKHDDHKDHDHDHDGHGEFNAQYAFTCENIDKLSQLDAQWFNTFPSTESITINAITEAEQLSGKLQPGSTVFKF
ncbi:DUF2796 domain-containing protein [Photobacterium sanctipauli]|uniref:DUF2796 domain-containing protein n=1 Tax=Photobacterium sanctipauli TaxID=1342794 RepID=A0A2T3NIT5_9GAMM|nr:DUF2796 domain-containing protein [Photobacterium sanctipauli]PSW15166.1 DUF2796 domain-containing protein [Photobacterium sanctipauli]